MNKEQEELLDAAYENYSKEYEKDNSIGMCLLVKRLDGKSTYRKPNKEMFVGLCTSDKTFSEKWGLKIEERELSLEERTQYKKKRDGIARTFAPYTHQMLDGSNIPTKLITIKYNDKTIESYE
jgi:hypothetical protein